MLILWFGIIFNNTNCYTQIRAVGNNKMAHIVEGNKVSTKKVLNIMHWNKGPSFLQNKVNDINYKLDKYRPHIFSLSEANFIINRDNEDLNFLHEYNYEIVNGVDNVKMSRQMVLINKQLNYVRRVDLESKNNCYL